MNQTINLLHKSPFFIAVVQSDASRIFTSLNRFAIGPPVNIENVVVVVLDQA